jgi:hypothetical protein
MAAEDTRIRLLGRNQIVAVIIETSPTQRSGSAPLILAVAGPRRGRLRSDYLGVIVSARVAVTGC